MSNTFMPLLAFSTMSLPSVQMMTKEDEVGMVCEVRTRTCMPHTLKLIIHQEQIAGALPDTGVENGQSAQQNSY